MSDAMTWTELLNDRQLRLDEKNSKIAELESALASERAKTAAARADYDLMREARDGWASRFGEMMHAQATIAQVKAELDRYDQSDEPEEYRECAPEDRWRLYRDLDAILANAAPTAAFDAALAEARAGALAPIIEHFQTDGPATFYRWMDSQGYGRAHKAEEAQK